jgi:hyaluronate lyase
VVLAPTAAGYVRDGGYARTNFASDPSLVVKHGPAGFTRETYLTFDLARVGTIHSSKLQLFGRLSQPAKKGVQVRVYAATATAAPAEGAAAKGRLTWKTRPPTAAGPAVAAATVSGTGGRWYEWDLTALLRAQRAAGAHTVTIALKGTAATDAAALFDTGTGGKGPRLVLA